MGWKVPAVTAASLLDVLVPLKGEYWGLYRDDGK